MSNELRIAIIQVFSELQSRTEMNQEHVSDLREVWQSWKEKQSDPMLYPFPPVVVFTDSKGNYWLADGFHRVEAAKLEGIERIKCEVKQGQQREALIYAAGANKKHGLKRTAGDKRRAVTILLDDEVWREKSDRIIGEYCGVHGSYVTKMRKQRAGADCQHLNDVQPQGGHILINDSALSDIQPIASTDTQAMPVLVEQVATVATPVEQPSAMSSPERRIGKDGKSYPAKPGRGKVIKMPTAQDRARQSLAVLAEVLIDAPPEIQQAIKILVAYFTPAALTNSQA